MSRFYSYISTALKIIAGYNGAVPLHHHLKKIFSLEKKYGSNDRKTIATLCYAYFRAGHTFKNPPGEETMLKALFLCSDHESKILEQFQPELNRQISLPVREKLSLLNIKPADVFPFGEYLSAPIPEEEFSISFLKQPALFVRIRSGRKHNVLNKLAEAGVSFEATEENSLKLVNTTSLEDILKINKDVVIQDINSARVFDFFKQFPENFGGENNISTWDCCAASGGKSILLYDILKGNIRLTVSDIRKSIMLNLQQRLKQANVPVHRYFIADLEKHSLSEDEEFSIIILDAPCTGSGTWSRTPEQLFYFNQATVDLYAERQKQIALNVIPSLKNDGLLFYITCSVFQKENEEVIEFIKEKFNLLLVQMEYLKGYNTNADTMFVAVFKKLPL